MSKFQFQLPDNVPPLSNMSCPHYLCLPLEVTSEVTTEQTSVATTEFMPPSTGKTRFLL